MKRLAFAVLMASGLSLTGCGADKPAGDTSGSSAAESSASSSSSPSESASASGCSAGGLDAMTALADFQLEMDAAQKSGKITVDQLTAARDKLFTDTQAAQEKEDWTAYCAAIDDTRAELGL